MKLSVKSQVAIEKINFSQQIITKRVSVRKKITHLFQCYNELYVNCNFLKLDKFSTYFAPAMYSGISKFSSAKGFPEKPRATIPSSS